MLVSVVIRTRDEEERINSCLFAVSNQSLSDFEIIIVDNMSNDNTLAIAKKHNVRIIQISDEEFTYGRALNRGIELAQGDYIALISGHCIPVDNYWLPQLLSNFQDPQVAGVYGRQQPLPDSNDFDKRDLWTTFGLERRIQRKDYFFHNANSMIKKSAWDEVRFHDESDGVEDRIWAKDIINRGYVVVYDPEASVYHHHGIHQGRDEKRAARVVKVIEMTLKP